MKKALIEGLWWPDAVRRYRTCNRATMGQTPGSGRRLSPRPNV